MGANNADFDMGRQHLPFQADARGDFPHEYIDTYLSRRPKEKVVEISDIKSSQTYVHPAQVEAMSKLHAGDLPPVHLWETKEGFNVIDGNHRVNAALARGERWVRAHVWSEDNNGAR